MAKELNAKGLDYHIIKQMTGDLISIQEEMMYEGNRLCSFQAWPTNAKAYAFQLVRSGFYYSGEADEVVCFACEGRIRDWQDDDIPMQKHIERYPNCPFVCGQISGINLMPPVLDDGHPTIQLMKRVDEVVVRTSETNQQIAARQFNLEMTNMAVSMTPGQVLVRPVPTQSMDVKRSAITFRDENQRKKSFEGFWSNMWPVTPNTLAQAGFFYCGPEDMVQCAWCYGKLQGWEQGDNPLKEHAHHFASCSKFGDYKAVDSKSLVKVKSDAGSNKWSSDDLGILTVCPCSPQFSNEASRLESFRGKWPSTLPQTAQVLSSAGFFYVGYSDNVKCFFCDGGLCNWEANEEPWTEHARWFPDCGFIKQVKGTRYTEKVGEVGVSRGLVPRKIATQLTESTSRTATTTATAASALTNQTSLTRKQKRQVRAAMSSPSVGKALETGIPKEVIETALKERWRTGECQFCDDESLIEASLLAWDHIAMSCNDVKAHKGPSNSRKHKKFENKITPHPPPPSPPPPTPLKRKVDLEKKCKGSLTPTPTPTSPTPNRSKKKTLDCKRKEYAK